MEELLARMNSDDVVAVVFLVLAFIAGLVVWLSLQWRLHRRTELEASLKHEMLDRGMTADEIERVLHAGMHGARRESGIPTHSRAAWDHK
jgi:hypothetical protein